MRYLRPSILLLTLLCVGVSFGQNQPKTESPKTESPKTEAPRIEAPRVTNEVEVKFGDSSTVRMIILQENVEVVTRFGKLTVPMTEVRKVDLGVHLPDGVAEKIQVFMKNLNSDVFKVRDEAVNQLVDLGPAAYPSLHAAIKSNDLEVSQRVQMAIKRIKAKYPAAQLRVAVNDRIVTTDFAIVGRIISPTIKAQTQYFGAVDLKLTELRSILWLSGNTEIEVSVDASKYCNTVTWMDSGITVESGAGLQINASGEIDLLPGNGPQFISGPQGNPNIGGRFGNRMPGSLVGKIGDGGTLFPIGERYNGTPTQEGKLFLQITPGNFGGNQPAQGTFKVRINTGLDVK